MIERNGATTKADPPELDPPEPRPIPCVLHPIQTYDRLGPEFFAATPPQGLPNPRLAIWSTEAARLLGLADPESEPGLAARWAAQFSGSAWPDGCPPLATVYSGHQFGVWAGQLGDGRAHLIGEVAVADPDQAAGYPVWEVQIKGAGRTPFSRTGDGRAVLRSSIREFLASEAMHHLGIPTTRALCLVASDLPVRRESIETAAVVTRLAPSFLRFGHFEHFADTAVRRGMADPALARLVDHALARCFPDAAAAAASAPEAPACTLLRETTRRTAHLLAQWQSVGFVHGVMNTDNMSLLGWTLDYGPFGFLNTFDPRYTPNTTDRDRRYCWYRQPAVAQWNLGALAHALRPLLPDAEAANDIVGGFAAIFDAALHANLAAKLGLLGSEDGDADLIQSWLELLATQRADWTLSHRHLAQGSADPAVPIPEVLRRGFAQTQPELTAWFVRYRARLVRQSEPGRSESDRARAVRMNRTNPLFVLRHHLLQHAIDCARQGEFTETRTLLALARRPYDEALPDQSHYVAAPPADAPEPCLSCSS